MSATPTSTRMHRGDGDSNGAEVYVRQQEAIIGRPDSRPMLAAIAVPTLIIVGEADQITPPEAAEEMHAGIAGSRLVVVAARRPPGAARATGDR